MTKGILRAGCLVVFFFSTLPGTLSAQTFTLLGDEYKNADSVLTDIGQKSNVFKPADLVRDTQLYFTPFFVFKGNADGRLYVKLDSPLPGSQYRRLHIYLLISPVQKTQAIAQMIRTDEHIRPALSQFANVQVADLISIPFASLRVSDEQQPELFKTQMITDLSLLSEVELVAELKDPEASQFAKELESGDVLRTFEVRYEFNARTTISSARGSMNSVSLSQTDAVKSLKGAANAFSFAVGQGGGSLGGTLVTRDQKSKFEASLRTEMQVTYEYESPDQLKVVQEEIDKYMKQVFKEEKIQADENFAKNIASLSAYGFQPSDLKADEMDKFVADVKNFFQSENQEKMTVGASGNVGYGPLSMGSSGNYSKEELRKLMEDKGWKFETSGKYTIPKSLDVYLVDNTALQSNQTLTVGLKQMTRSLLPMQVRVSTNHVLYPGNLSDLATEFALYKTKVVPIGTILPFAGSVDKIPAGWRLCNGDELEIANYSELYSAIGANWGQSDKKKFNLPDLRGMFLRGVDAGAGTYKDAAKRGIDDKKLPMQKPAQNTGDTVGSLQPDSFNYSGNATVNFYDLTTYGTRDEGVNKFPGAYTFYTNQDKLHPSQWAGQLIPRTPDPAGETRPINAAVNWIIRVI
jgi:hypothetical protein